MTRCTAKSKRSGERCKRSAAIGRTTCAMHGGKSLVGPAHPNYESGRYSRLLPTNLAARYERARIDQNLVALQDELALLDARLQELVATLGAPAVWRQAIDAYQKLEAARRSGDASALRVALTDLGAVLQDGAASGETWHELSRLIEQRRKLSESERKRIVEARMVLTAEEALTLTSALVAAVKVHVPDPDARQAIASEVASILGRTGLPGVAP